MKTAARIILPMLLTLVACSKEQPKSAELKDQPQSSSPVRKMYKIGKLPDFEFQEAQGRGIKRADMLGKVWVAATIFTACTTACPAICQEMYGLQQEFSDAKDFRLVTVSVDPANDTVLVLRKYAKAYYANPDRWYFLRHPDRAAVRAFVVDGLKIAWDDDEPLTHSARIALIDREGILRGAFERTDPDAMKALRKHIRELLKPPAKS